MKGKAAGKVRVSVHDMTVLSLLGAMMIGGKEAMSALPNIEPVSLLILVCTCVYGFKALYPVYIFVIVEGLLYGFGMWFFGYLYVWAVLVLITIPVRKIGSPIIYASVSGLFGLCFGAMFAIQYLFIGGWRAALSYWISGIPFDIIHAVGNFLLVLFLAKPCINILGRLSSTVSH